MGCSGALTSTADSCLPRSSPVAIKESRVPTFNGGIVNDDGLPYRWQYEVITSNESLIALLVLHGTDTKRQTFPDIIDRCYLPAFTL